MVYLKPWFILQQLVLRIELVREFGTYINAFLIPIKLMHIYRFDESN